MSFIRSRNRLPPKYPNLLAFLQPLHNLAAGGGHFGFVPDEAGLHRLVITHGPTSSSFRGREAEPGIQSCEVAGLGSACGSNARDAIISPY
jgi:hypothetical protein